MTQIICALIAQKTTIQKTTHNGISGVRLSEVRREALMQFLRGQGMLVLPDNDMLIYWHDWQRFLEQQA